MHALFAALISRCKIIACILGRAYRLVVPFWGGIDHDVVMHGQVPPVYVPHPPIGVVFILVEGLSWCCGVLIGRR